MAGRAHGLKWLRSCDPGPRLQVLPGWLPPSGVTGFAGGQPTGLCLLDSSRHLLRGTLCRAQASGPWPSCSRLCLSSSLPWPGVSNFAARCSRGCLCTGPRSRSQKGFIQVRK